MLRDEKTQDRADVSKPCNPVVPAFPVPLVPDPRSYLYGIFSIGSSITAVRFPSFSAYAHSP